MKIFGRRSGRSNISRKYALKAARLVVACALLAGCNVFSMVGILDGSSSSSTSTTSGGSSTLQVLPTAANIVVNTTKEFAATGGSGGYTYTVDAGGVGGWMVGSVYHAPPLDTGTDSVTVTDSAGATSTATAMVVPPGTDPLTISPASATISVGGTITFTANGGSGTGYSYSINPPVGAGTIVPGTGLYTAPWSFATPVIRVTDSGANTADTVLITVNAPTAVQIAPSTAVVNAGGVTNFTASGGSGSYTYSVNPPVGAGTIVPGTGQYTAPWSSVTPVIHVIDNNTGGTADTVLVTVNAPPALQISPKVTTVFATGSVSFSASGGSGIPGNYSYSWVSGPGGLGSVVGAAYTPGIAGPPPGVIRVTDTATGQTDDATVTVDPVPVALTISPKTITINAGDILLMSAAGGVPLYTFAKVDGGGTFAGSTYTAPWSATTAHIRVTDSDTPPSTDIATITVNAPPALVISPSTTTLNVGQWVTFTGSGGSNILGNYSYTKTSGGGSFSPGTATYTAPGSATTATIRLRDNATGQTAIATSQKMADSVVRYLVLNHQIPVFRIHVLSLGNATLASDGTAAKRVSGGRVEINVLRNDLVTSAQ